MKKEEVQLSKELQKEIMKFFMRTSVPRIIKEGKYTGK